MRSKTIVLLLLFLMYSILILSFDTGNYVLFLGTDFSDGVFDFVAGSGATVRVVEVDGNKCLEVSGSGSGTRIVEKKLEKPTSHAKVIVTFDWKPEEVATAQNSIEILFSDSNDNPILRLVKKGGTNGPIGFGIGSTGVDLSDVEFFRNISTDGSWLIVHILFDFVSETVSIRISNRDDPSRTDEVISQRLKNVYYLNKIAKISVKGNRASGQNLSFKTLIDNLSIFVSEEMAPTQSEKSIVEILPAIGGEYRFPRGARFEDVVSYFPSSVDVRLENGALVRNVPLNWSCLGYDPNVPGLYKFVGTPVTERFPNVKNERNVSVEITVLLIEETAKIPEIENYKLACYTDFGDTVNVVPKYWGFSTANATLSIDTKEVGGNRTPKLMFSQVNQTGGRVATRKFDPPVRGDFVLVKLDWYPGTLNEKGNNPQENAGELQFFDSLGNLILALNNTRGLPLRVISKEEVVETGLTNPNTWINVEVVLDNLSKSIHVNLLDTSSGRVERYSVSLKKGCDGSLGAVRLAGIRTPGNNITWTTYLDNFYVYYRPTPENRIVSVEKLPYRRIYVGTAETIEEIGLPKTVRVTLASGETREASVERWEVIGGAWEPSKPGIYAFKGVIGLDGEIDNSYGLHAICYVYNRLPPTVYNRQREKLGRGLVALKADGGIFVSWRLSSDEYRKDVRFLVYRNGELVTKDPLAVTNFLDPNGKPGDVYRVETLLEGQKIGEACVTALPTDYISVPLQKPADGVNALGERYSYFANDCSVGDLDGDGEYEIVVKWLPSNAIDSASAGLTGPTIIDAYKLDGTPLWRINLGLNMTSGPHYNPFLVYDFDGDGKSEVLLKTADGTTVYGVVNGKIDESRVVCVIGDPSRNGAWIFGPNAPENLRGKVFGGPEYISVFDGKTGAVIDSIEYRFSIERAPVETWGDNWYNRSDRFLAAVAYLNGTTPSAVYGRGYYARTTFVAYDLVNGKLVERWYFDTREIGGRGEGMGNHNLSVADVDNDGCDEIIAGALTLDHDGTILYVMDGEMGRERGSHGDALHVGAFDPDVEGLQVVHVREDPAVASLVYYDAATGETFAAFYAYKDCGRGVAANITSSAGYEFWGAADPEDVNKGAGVYNVKGTVVHRNCKEANLPMNFAIYWDDDLLQELLDDVYIYKYDEVEGKAKIIKRFEGVVSVNGTKATPCLQADILGDWREEVIFPTEDSSELRIFSTTVPTQYRIFTLMHDWVYRLAIAWQNVGYNQPPHLGFYLGEDIRDIVLQNGLPTR